MKTEQWNVERLVPYARNPRKNDAAVDKVAASIKEFGFRQPIVVDTEGVIIAGHTRYKAAKKLGLAEVPVHVADGLSPAQVKAYRIADNKVGELAEWDMEMLALEIEDLKVDAYDLELTGFDLDELPGQQENPDLDAEPQIDRAEELRKEWGVEPGQLWELGDHRLLCGDSTKADDVARVMGGEKAWLIATDPPYGVDFQGAKYNPRAKDWASIENDKRQGSDLREWLSGVWCLWLQHCEKQAAFYSWAAAMEEGAAAAAMRDAGIHVQSQIIWNKNALVLGQADYQWKHENCWYGFLKGEKHRWFGERKQTTVWEISRVAHIDYVHPMQKPVELYAVPIRNHTKDGEILGEPFSGSGTTIIACEQLGRKCRAIEISPAYVAVALQRWADATGKTPRLIT